MTPAETDAAFDAIALDHFDRCNSEGCGLCEPLHSVEPVD
jgi:hypothetical protein